MTNYIEKEKIAKAAREGKPFKQAKASCMWTH